MVLSSFPGHPQGCVSSLKPQLEAGSLVSLYTSAWSMATFFLALDIGCCLS